MGSEMCIRDRVTSWGMITVGVAVGVTVAVVATIGVGVGVDIGVVGVGFSYQMVSRGHDYRWCHR